MRTTTAPRPRTLAALLVLGLGGSLLLAACTGSRSDDEVEPPQTPTFHELTVPGDAVPTGVQVGDVSVLGGMGGSSEVPVLVVGKRAVARELPRLAVWSAAAGTQITDEPQLLETVGAPVEVDLDGDPDLSAVAGYSWRAGVEAPYLFTSTDRSRWEQVEIPADLAGLRPVQVAVDGDTTYVLGIDTDDRLAGLRVADGTVEPLDLPKTQDVASVTAAEASGGVLVLATAPSSGTGDGPEIFTSTDGT
ncbi:hypothetical protein LEP48_07905 [Isoptericola sp. NEAU-Y5]|uniref:Lipoprotein n=1 Tax=Isoptericola luteus TaxID=2879484 RepID=A0ABS7ZE11_9MICO|nr:hypothetical protein [Isoptericola sp. NEAU-Y5]MCA5893283.1 hypothetical protein [Isoptericola sp. NEAU-Y5]